MLYPKRVYLLSYLPKLFTLAAEVIFFHDYEMRFIVFLLNSELCWSRKMKWSQSLTQASVGEFLSPIVAERNTEIMKLRPDFLLELPGGNLVFVHSIFSPQPCECAATITTGVQLRFKPHIGPYL